MASLSLPIPVEELPRPHHKRLRRAHERTAPPLGLLVAGFGDPVAADYLSFVRGPEITDAHSQITDLSDPTALLHLPSASRRVTSLVLFLKPSLTATERHALEALLDRGASWQPRLIVIVSTFRIHLGDERAAAAEARLMGRARELGARVVVFRPGQVVSHSSRLRRSLRRFGCCYPLVPRRLTSCWLDGAELFAAMEMERQEMDHRRVRTFTLLGPQRPWREVLAEQQRRGFGYTCLTALCALAACLLLGQIAGLLVALLARRRPGLRQWCFDTLRPRSLGELLILYNKHNYRHVKVVGYNNGVVHFGHRYPGKTIVSTVHCDRVIAVGADEIKVDCGATVHRAQSFLAARGQEMYVVPNYSYVCLGTSFFVPIHGSAADASTIADTITRVVLHDPVQDRLIAARRDEPAFRSYLYNLQADVLVLRLRVRVKPKSRYFVRKQVVKDATSAAIVSALQDPQATNVELRKAQASSDRLTVYKYYKDAAAASSGVLELPRDTLGSLWDRLEENALTSFLMHALTRHFAWHVELFFTGEELATFWQGHQALPLRKLQLRYIRSDGMPCSPFRDYDCISVDLFMLRRHRRRFEAYLRSTFSIVRTNPGKHSR
jgi:hypothetical protein